MQNFIDYLNEQQNEQKAPLNVCAVLCAECPFRKRAVDVIYTGPYATTAELASAAKDESGFACHMLTRDLTRFNPGYGPAKICKGSLHFMANIAHRPKNARIAELVKQAGPSDDVFGFDIYSKTALPQND